MGFFFRSRIVLGIFFRALKFERVLFVFLKSENFEFSKFRILGISNNLKTLRQNFGRSLKFFKFEIPWNFEFDQFFFKLAKRKNIIHTNI